MKKSNSGPQGPAAEAAKEKKMTVKYYKRSIDAGNGNQIVEVENKVIKAQWLESNGNHEYTGDGNPEIVGKKIGGGKGAVSLTGMGFVSVSETETDRRNEDAANEILEEMYNDQ